MTDPKRTTLPGPGSQPSHPAPEPPAESVATAVLGTLPSGTPVERSSPLLPAIEDDEEERPGFNPFKFQRITVPPGLRADMIRWSREGKAEQPPEEALDGEPDLESASAESDQADDPGSVMPVGASGAPRLPLRSARGVALAAALVILPLVVLGLASAMRRPSNANVNVNAPAAAAQGLGESSEAPSAVARPVPTLERAPATPATATATTTATARATASARPRSASPVPSATSERRVPEPARPIRSAEPASTAPPNENALDRPFSLPK